MGPRSMLCHIIACSAHWSVIAICHARRDQLLHFPHRRLKLRIISRQLDRTPRLARRFASHLLIEAIADIVVDIGELDQPRLPWSGSQLPVVLGFPLVFLLRRGSPGEDVEIPVD